MTQAIVLINAQTDQVSALAQQLIEIKGVSEVFSVAGRHDLVAVVRVATNDDLATVVSDRIRKLPGISNTETLIAFRVYSARELDAGFSLGMDE